MVTTTVPPHEDPDHEAYAALGLVHFLRTAAGVDTSAAQGRVLFHSVRSETFRILYSPDGVPVGYVLWAGIGRDTYLHMRDGGAPPSYLHEWKEGALALVLDALVLPEWRGAVTAALLAGRRVPASVVVARPGRPVRRYGRHVPRSTSGRHTSANGRFL